MSSTLGKIGQETETLPKEGQEDHAGAYERTNLGTLSRLRNTLGKTIASLSKTTGQILNLITCRQVDILKPL